MKSIFITKTKNLWTDPKKLINTSNKTFDISKDLYYAEYISTFFFVYLSKYFFINNDFFHSFCQELDTTLWKRLFSVVKESFWHPELGTIGHQVPKTFLWTSESSFQTIIQTLWVFSKLKVPFTLRFIFINIWNHFEIHTIIPGCKIVICFNTISKIHSQF